MSLLPLPRALPPVLVETPGFAVVFNNACFAAGLNHVQCRRAMGGFLGADATCVLTSLPDCRENFNDFFTRGVKMAIAAPPESLGQDLRVLRKRRGMSLAQVADAMGRSVGWLSQVERNLSEPSREEIYQFAQILGISAASFFGREPALPEEADVIVRKNARRPIGPRIGGLQEELVSPDLTDDFEVIHSTFQPGAVRSDTVTRPTQEVGFIVSGELEITIGDHTFTVGPGDSFRIRGEPFRWANRGTVPCVAIWVIAPPVY